MRPGLLPAIAVAFLGACSALTPQGPRPERVEPDSAREGVETPVTIRGRDFFVSVRPSYVDRQHSLLDSTFKARLGDTALRDVIYVDFNTLTAVVPAGLAPGSHDLVVEDPEGRSGKLEDAFAVLPPARKIVIEDAPGGTGSEVMDTDLKVGQMLVLFAVGRLEDGSFVEDAEASWSVLGEIGSLEPASGSRTVFTAEAIGTGAVRAERDGQASDETGEISVTTCSSDTECADRCHTGASCTDGKCSMGEVDKDADGDGLIDIACPGGGDCDDDNPNCGADCTDRDEDGFCATHDCDDDPDACGEDCYPENSAADVCDGHDQDCDGETDEEPDIAWYRDADGDGYGDAGDEISSCDRPEGYVEDATDCADGAEADPACNGLNGSQCHPGIDEDGCDGADNDCDGDIDEDHSPTATACGRGACRATGELRCVGGSEQDTCTAGSPAADDSTCNNLDDDCDGSTDEDYVVTTTYCGVGECAGNSGSLICSNGIPTDTCDPLQGAAADDTSCDNLDDDCDGSTDEEYVVTTTYCGVGECAGNSGSLICSNGVPTDTCDPLQGAAADDTSCDNLDDDCDGSTDDDYVITSSPPCGVGECAGNSGEIVCLYGVETNTCNPTQGAVEESDSAGNCSDSADNDCDGLTDAADTGCVPTANTPPIARFYVDPPAGIPGTLFNGHASATTDAEDDIGSLTFSWDWDNDGVTDGEGVDSSHVFSTEDTHTVVLMVEDTGGLRGWATFDVIVSPASELLVVTTEIDEADGGATPASPGGSGFSLREAIVYADGRAGKQTIYVPSGYLIDLASSLPGPSDDSGLEIVADGVALDGSGASATCLDINGNNNHFYGLEIFNCSIRALSFSGGTGNRFARGYVHDNADGIELADNDNILGPDNEIARNGARGVKVMGRAIVEWNRIHGHTNVGISLTGQSDGSIILGNFVYANTTGIDASGPCDGNVYIHNTVHANTENGVDLGNGSTNTDFRNNILSYNGLSGLYFGGGSFLERDHNDYYLNGSGACSGCAALGPNSMTDDPFYVNAAAYDLRLRGDSTLIDQGAVLSGVDVNRAEPGDYNGGTPDIGAWESP